MPYTSPAAQSSGAVAPVSWATAVKADLDYLANPPACRVYHNTTQNLPDSVITYLAFNSESYDTDTMHDTVTNNSRITFKTAGLFLLEWNVELSARNDYQNMYHAIRKNGTTLIWEWRYHVTNIVSDVREYQGATVKKFAVSDFIELGLYQDNVANATPTVVAGSTDRFGLSATWIGLG